MWVRLYFCAVHSNGVHVGASVLSADHSNGVLVGVAVLLC